MAREFALLLNFLYQYSRKKNYQSQTHFGWSTILELQDKKNKGEFLKDHDAIPEPEEWFHDIFRIDGSPFDEKETKFIKKIIND